MEAPPYEQVPQPDVLPSYQPRVNRKGRLLCKQELETPDTPALQRHWHRVEAELRGTKFLLSKVSCKDSSTGTRTKCSRSFTLQAADVGLATDHSQWPNVFRARLEGEQLLFIAPGVEAAMAWLESLGAAIAISEPLEARKMPGHPRRPARATKPWALGSASGDGFGSRLWTELAWRARQRHEWLFETPSRPRNERWREVVHGRESNHRSRPRSTRLWKSTRSAAAEPGSNGRSVSSTSQCQCPCSSCWRQGAQDRPAGRAKMDHDEGEIQTEVIDRLGGLPSELLPSLRCMRTLKNCEPWKSSYFIKNGRRIKTPRRPPETPAW